MLLKNLPQDQQKVVIALLSNNTLLAACEDSGIGLTKLHRLLNDEKFKKTLDKERNKMFREAMDAIKGHTNKAVEVLVALLKSDDEKIRRGVANDILDKAFKGQEMMQFEERIKKLENELCGLTID